MPDPTPPPDAREKPTSQAGETAPPVAPQAEEAKPPQTPPAEGTPVAEPPPVDETSETSEEQATPAAPAAAESAGSPAISLPPAPKYQWMAGLREITTTLIALVILTITMILVMRTFGAAGDDFEKMKDVLLYVLPILGTVMGYYFGRVPAERRAEASEHKADQAQVTAQAATQQVSQVQTQTQQKLQQAKVGVERAQAKLEAAAGASATRGRGGEAGLQVGAARVSASEASAILAELESVSKLL